MKTHYKQFVVRDVVELDEDCPVDNFIWKDDSLNAEVTLSISAGKVYINLNADGEEQVIECPDVITGLIRMAEALDRLYGGTPVMPGTTTTTD